MNALLMLLAALFYNAANLMSLYLAALLLPLINSLSL